MHARSDEAFDVGRAESVSNCVRNSGRIPGSAHADQARTLQAHDSEPFSGSTPILAGRRRQVSTATPPRSFLPGFHDVLVGTIAADHPGMLDPIHATELLLEVMLAEEDDDELLTVLLTCQRALREFEFAIQELLDLESDIRTANTTSAVDELEDRLACIRTIVRGTALERRVVRANRELERQRDRLT